MVGAFAALRNNSQERNKGMYRSLLSRAIAQKSQEIGCFVKAQEKYSIQPDKP